MLAKGKLNSIEILVSQAINMEISHEEFVTILKGKCKYESMKENLRNINQKLEEKTENMRLNSFNSRSFFFVKKKRLWMNYITSDFNQLEDLSA